MQAQTIIKAALRVAGVIATGETPSNDELQDGLESLNMMLRNWFSDSVNVFTLIKESFTLSSGTAEYTIGTAGTFNTDRPLSINQAFIRDSNYDYELNIVSGLEYWKIFNKALQGRPEYLMYKPETPLGKVYLFYTPDSNYSLHLVSQKPLDDLSGITSTTEFPSNYDEAMKWNLAMRLMPEYGIAVSPEIVKFASDSYNRITSLNASLQVAPVSFEIDRNSRYNRTNIFTG
ncbi:MAG: hypothetical protein HQK79_14180 [Desulfobacterales bacterium]|nr:hypothetical protein [Desulfobacterales bacterium]